MQPKGMNLHGRQRRDDERRRRAEHPQEASPPSVVIGEPTKGMDEKLPEDARSKVPSEASKTSPEPDDDLLQTLEWNRADFEEEDYLRLKRHFDRVAAKRQEFQGGLAKPRKKE